MDKKKVLILGASGYIGREISALLQASGQAEPVRASRRGPDLQIDATDPRALRQAMAGTDAVVNSVAGSTEAIVQGARALASALREMGSQAPRLVHLSSMAAYGHVDGRVDEQTPLLGDLGPYSRAKQQAEQILAGIGGSVILRPGCVYGPGAPLWSTLIAQLLRTRRIGDLGPAGAACSNIVHVYDVATAVMHSLALPSRDQEVFNLAMRDAPTWNGYFQAYAAALGATPVTRVGPARLFAERWLATPLSKGVELGNRVLPRPLRLPVPARIPLSLLELWQHDIRLDASRAETVLGMSWQPLQPALERMAAADGGAPG